MSTSDSASGPRSTVEDGVEKEREPMLFEKEQFLSEPSEQDGKGDTTRRRQNFFSINRKFIPVKLVYFFMGSAVGVSFPFVPLYLYQLGLSTVSVGFITSLRAAMALVATPVWGSIADKFKLHRCLFLCCIIGICIAPFSLILIPPVPNDLCQPSNVSIGVTVGSTDRDAVTHQHGNESVVMATPNVPSVLYTTLEMSPSATRLTTEDVSNGSDVFVTTLLVFPSTVYGDILTSLVPSYDKNDVTSRNSIPTFATAFCSMFFIYMFVVNYHVFSDSNTIELCKKYKGSTYGKQRWLASLAVIIMSFLAGVLLEWSEKRFNADSQSCYDGKYFLPLVLVTALTSFVSLFPFSKMEVVSKEPTESISKSVFKLLTNFYVFRFFVTVIVSGASKGIVMTYMFLFLEDLNAPKILIGLCFVFECIAEMPCMMFSQNVINLLGTRAVINIGVVAFAIRLLGLSFLHNPWFVIPMELLHGMAYGLLWPSFVVYGNQIAPEGMAATVQSMIAASNEGFGEIVGILIGGVVYDAIGPRILFQGTSCCCVIVFLLMCIPVKEHLTIHERSVETT